MKRVCIFRTKFLREQVNPRLARDTPFGAFQKVWRDVHCSQLDVYGTGSCPYKPEDCALAYLQIADKANREAGRTRVGMFRTLARTYGAVRADNKPLAREKLVSDDDPGALGSDLDERSGLRRSRPRSISSLFGEEDGGSLPPSTGGREGPQGTG